MLSLAAAGEEEDADEWPLGTVEKCPASLRPPGASVVASFKSDRQKHETVAPDSILTKIVVGEGGGVAGDRGWGADGVCVDEVMHHFTVSFSL